MDEYTITITLKNVAEGDATSVAQDIWDRHAADLDAPLGDFSINISKGRFGLDWEPSE